MENNLRKPWNVYHLESGKWIALPVTPVINNNSPDDDADGLRVYAESELPAIIRAKEHYLQAGDDIHKIINRQTSKDQSYWIVARNQIGTWDSGGDIGDYDFSCDVYAVWATSRLNAVNNAKRFRVKSK